MKRIVGTEMKRLMLAVTLAVLLLLVAIISYFLIDVLVTSYNNTQDNKELMIAQSVRTVDNMGANIEKMTTDWEFIELFNIDYIQRALAGDMKSLYGMIVRLTVGIQPVDYVAVIAGGQIVDYRAKDGMTIDKASMLVTPPEDGYQTLDRLGDREGFFISCFYSVPLSRYGFEDLYLNIVVDRTSELQAIEGYFQRERNNMLTGLLIAGGIAILLSILVTTFGLRFLVEKYIVKPIEQLNRTAEQISQGCFEGEVHVDEKSAFAALQGLLKSGQVIMRLHDREIAKKPGPGSSEPGKDVG